MALPSQIADQRSQELLLICARLDVGEQKDRLRELAQSEQDWSTVISLAQRNGLAPLLSYHLSKHAADIVPADHLNFLRDYYRKNHAFNLLLTGELAHLLRTFSAHQMQAMPYKGPALAVGLYGNLGLRQFCDLDILVRAVDVWRATDLLVQEGFEPHFVIPSDKRDAFVRLGYVRLFRRDQGRTIVELHWRVAPRFFDVPFAAEDFWPRLKTIELAGTQVLFPEAEDLLLMLSIHGAKDFWEKLEWVTGIAELLRQNPQLDWEQTLETAKGLRCERALHLGVYLAHQLLGAPLPEPIKSTFAVSKHIQAMAAEISRRFFAVAPRDLKFAGRVRFHLRCKDRYRDRLRYCSRLALTTTPIDWATVSLPRSLTFLYLPLRALRLAKRYGLNNGVEVR